MILCSQNTKNKKPILSYLSKPRTPTWTCCDLSGTKLLKETTGSLQSRLFQHEFKIVVSDGYNVFPCRSEHDMTILRVLRIRIYFLTLPLIDISKLNLILQSLSYRRLLPTFAGSTDMCLRGHVSRDSLP